MLKFVKWYFVYNLNQFKAAHCIDPKTNGAVSEKLKPRDVMVILGAFNLSNSNEFRKKSQL